MNLIGNVLSSALQFVRSNLGYAVEEAFPLVFDCADIKTLTERGHWDAVFQCAGIDPSKRLDFLVNNVEHAKTVDEGLSALNVAKIVLFLLHSLKYVVIMPLVLLLLLWFAYYVAVHVKSRNEEKKAKKLLEERSRKYINWERESSICFNCLKVQPDEEDDKDEEEDDSVEEEAENENEASGDTF